MKRLWLLTLLGAVLLSGTAARADGDFYVVGNGSVGTKITSVPYIINQPGFYFFTRDLTYTGSSHAIIVNVDNVTIDLMGFSLSYNGTNSGGFGVYMYERNNVEVRNGTVRNFSGDGIGEYGSGANHRVVNVRVFNNSQGIRLYSSNNLVKDCTAANNLHSGIWIGSGNVIGCVAFNNESGIANYGPGNVLNNSAYNNTAMNFEMGFYAPTSILLDRNSAYGLSKNYYITYDTPGVVITANNSGTP
jgi:parallel beta-helix repeat protein